VKGRRLEKWRYSEDDESRGVKWDKCEDDRIQEAGKMNQQLILQTGR